MSFKPINQRWLSPVARRRQAAADVTMSPCHHRHSHRAAATALPPSRCAPPPQCTNRRTHQSKATTLAMAVGGWGGHSQIAFLKIYTLCSYKMRWYQLLRGEVHKKYVRQIIGYSKITNSKSQVNKNTSRGTKKKRGIQK